MRLSSTTVLGIGQWKMLSSWRCLPKHWFPRTTGEKCVDCRAHPHLSAPVSLNSLAYDEHLKTLISTP